MYYRWIDPNPINPKWVRTRSALFFASPTMTSALHAMQIEIKHESCSPKQREQQLKFIRNGKIHLAIANLKACMRDTSIQFTDYQRSLMSTTIEILQQKLN